MAITKMRFFAECCRRCPPAWPRFHRKRASIRISLCRLGAKSHFPAIARSSREEPASLPPGCARARGNGQNEPTTVREAKRGNDQARSGNGQTSKDTERARGHAARGAAGEARCDRRRLQHPCLSNQGGAPRLGCGDPWRETRRRRRCQSYLCEHHSRPAEAVRIGGLTAAAREPSLHLARVSSLLVTA